MINLQVNLTNIYKSEVNPQNKRKIFFGKHLKKINISVSVLLTKTPTKNILTEVIQ